jgi:hypothetical protein
MVGSMPEALFLFTLGLQVIAYSIFGFSFIFHTFLIIFGGFLATAFIAMTIGPVICGIVNCQLVPSVLLFCFLWITLTVMVYKLHESYYQITSSQDATMTVPEAKFLAIIFGSFLATALIAMTIMTIGIIIFDIGIVDHQQGPKVFWFCFLWIPLAVMVYKCCASYNLSMSRPGLRK